MVDLDAAEVRLFALTLEGFLRLHARNGRTLAPGDPRRATAAKLALASPFVAVDLCPSLLAAAGPTVAAEVRSLAGGTPLARQGEQRAVSELPELMSAREAADASGLTVRGVRQAIQRGLLPATQDHQTGRWWIGRHAYQEWEAGRAA